ncbi:D-inositol 3-phosphate glycosyltransferase [bacterium BMS3Bbin06]|nr:D-inositol 3-phosphate glycosyltransferase [bacterium BMS3Abin08]GBE34221.1 D-inositol 3-phosphate glycosyltransferase [bacterium BMS3Bbin06]HDY72140.1 glycosyltransferase family 4 protein [Nitrospirota bacterium]
MAIKARNKRLTVLHVATLNQPIKPDLGYGPIETVIHNIDKGLHSLGHRSIVACSGDSRVAGEHYVTVEKSIGDYWSKNTPERRKTMNMHLSRALDRARMGDIDVVHTHDLKTLEYIYNAVSSMHVPIVMTLHVAAKDYLMEGVRRRWYNPLSSSQVHCVPISEYQKREYYGLNTKDVVYHGVEVENYPVKKNPDKESYLFTIGRVTRDKGQDKAIEVAKRTGSKLIIAGCVQDKTADREFFAELKNSIDLFVDVGKQPVNSDYYERVIKPLLDCDKQIIYIGEISSAHKKQWYRHARATLFPIQWGEPFGLVLIESMACGTPAIAFNKGAVPEIMVDGKTGFVVDSMSAMIKAVKRIDSIDPSECRRHVQNHFSIASMAYKYSTLYQHIAIDHKVSNSYSRLLIGYLPKPLQHGSLAT